jgi:Flp pilus assembly protein TadG
MSILSKRLRAFGRRQDGNATIEFVFLFPLFMAIFLMGFESGYYMVRTVMLERAVDMSVRDIRLGNGRVPEFAAVKENICENAIIFPKCDETIHVYMEEVAIAPGAIAAVTGPARCTNRFSEDPQYNEDDYNVGNSNTMMVVQVCAVVSPFFPTTGIGLGLQNAELGVAGVENAGMMAIVATTAFVNEPGTRAMAPYSPPMGSGTGTGGGGGTGGSGGSGDISNL